MNTHYGTISHDIDVFSRFTYYFTIKSKKCRCIIYITYLDAMGMGMPQKNFEDPSIQPGVSLLNMNHFCCRCLKNEGNPHIMCLKVLQF